MSNAIPIDGQSLSIEEVEAVARHHAPAVLAPEARARVEASHAAVARILSSGRPVYGVSTGVGTFADRAIAQDQASQLSYNQILSHSAGVGEPFSPDIVRAAMLIRANSLAGGFSGVRPIIIETLLHMLRAGVTPEVPSQGSLGSSGDLAPLAHMSIVLTSDPAGGGDEPSGVARYGDEVLSGAEAMRRAGIERVALGPKEGLALTNGATFTSAMLALSLRDAERILFAAEIAAAMSLEALLGVSAAFDARLHDVRPHPGQQQVAAHLRKLTAGSQLLDSGSRVQDAYSLRCIPQIQGPAWEVLDFAAQSLEIEINSATDNPLLFGEEALSGGNFHGEPLGLAADYLKIALAEVGALSERRLFRLVTDQMNAGLPPMLISDRERAGLQSGLMMLQYSSASLVLENQALAAPNSIHSLPTSAGQEDANANSATAARHLLGLISNLRHVVAMEMLAAAQALDLRLRLQPDVRLGRGTAAAHEAIRRIIPFLDSDVPLNGYIIGLAESVAEWDFIQQVEDAGA